MRRRLRVSRGRLRRYVARAIEALPEPFRIAVENVVVVVENRPRPDDFRGGARHAGEPLMGVYRGIPLPERAGYQMVVPDVIAVFRKPLLQACRTRREVQQDVRLTVLHEFGHYMGLDEQAVEHL